MIPGLGSALISGGSQLGSSLFGFLQQASANRAQKELAKYSYDQQRAMIREQNLYNSPAQQMARFKEAGLNPHLIYGQGTPGNQAQIAKYQAPRIDPYKPNFDLAPAVNAYNQTRITKAQINNLDADVLKKNEETKGIGLSNLRKILDNKQFEKLMPGVLEKQQLDLQNLDEMNKKIVAERKLAEIGEKLQTLKRDHQAIINDLADKGIFPGDALPWRLLVRMGDKASKEFMKVWEELSKPKEYKLNL